MKNKDNLSSVDLIFEEHKKEKQVERFKKNRIKLFGLGLLSGLVLLSVFYFISDYSKVQGIQITGNIWLKEDTIMNTLEIDSNSRTLFLFESLLKSKAKDCVIIDDLKLNKNRDGSIEIKIDEKDLVGYRFDEKAELVTSNGECFDLTNDYYYLMARLPFIVGFNTPQTEEEIENKTPTLLVRLANALKDVKPETIQLISEIHQFEYSYDTDGVLCIMQDGNEVYGSLYSMKTLNGYNQVASALENKRNCIYIDEMSGNPYTSMCPDELAAQEALEAEKEKNLEETTENKKTE